MERNAFYANARNDLTGPLDGLTVVEATTTWAGPMAACLLADLGARVIKIEMPTGEVCRRFLPRIPDSQLSVAHENVNRNKENLSIDLHTDAGRSILLKLIAQADVFIENFRPGVMDEWGLGYAHMQQVKPDIIYLSISGFGQFGTLHERAGYDPIALHYSGWASLNGDPDGRATRAPTFLGDDLAGMHGALGVLAALHHRTNTGEGQHIDTALVDSVLFQSNGLATAGALNVDVPRTGNRYILAAPVDTYACSDGEVFSGVLLDSHWETLCQELGCKELTEMTTVDRLREQPLVEKKLADYCAVRTTQEVLDRMAAIGLPTTRVNSFADAAREDHVKSRDMLQDTVLGDGKTVPLTGPAVKFSRTPTSVRHAAPAVGADTSRILADLGYSDAQIDQLREQGTVK